MLFFFFFNIYIFNYSIYLYNIYIFIFYYLKQLNGVLAADFRRL